MKKCPSVPKNTAIVFAGPKTPLADPERNKDPRFVSTATKAAVYDDSVPISASRARNRVEQGASSRASAVAPEVQDQVGQGQAGGKFHSLLGLRFINSNN